MSASAELLDEPAPVAEALLLPETSESVFEPSSSRLFYGWLMLPLAMLMMVATSPGQTFGITFFNSYFRDTFALSQTRLSAIYLVATVVASLALPSVGGLVDRFGLRSAALTAVLALASVCLMMSQATGIVVLFFAFVALRILGPGTLTLLANNTLAAWFDRRLGMASGLMQLSMAGAMAVIPVGIVALIDTFGWRGAYLALAAILAGGLLPLLAVFYRQSPDDVGQLPDGSHHSLHAELSSLSKIGLTLQQAKTHRAYWILLTATATWALIGTGFVFHLEALFAAEGLTKTDSARAMSFLAGGMALAQVFGGLLADRLAVRWLLTWAVTLIGVTSGVLALGIGWLLVPCFAVYGVAQGSMSIVAGTAWARYFGRAHLGKIRGMSLTAAVAGSSLGPLVMGVSDDYLGGFGPSLWLFAGWAAIVAFASIWATPPAQGHE